MDRTQRRRRCRTRRVTCARTGKVRYRDGDDAGPVLRGLKRAGARADNDAAVHRIRVVRKYACEHCGGWHLTSWATPAAPAAAVA